MGKMKSLSTLQASVAQSLMGIKIQKTPKARGKPERESRVMRPCKESDR